VYEEILDIKSNTVDHLKKHFLTEDKDMYPDATDARQL